jgi:hypothetical protein
VLLTFRITSVISRDQNAALSPATATVVLVSALRAEGARDIVVEGSEIRFALEPWPIDRGSWWGWPDPLTMFAGGKWTILATSAGVQIDGLLRAGLTFWAQVAMIVGLVLLRVPLLIVAPMGAAVAASSYYMVGIGLRRWLDGVFQPVAAEPAASAT